MQRDWWTEVGWGDQGSHGEGGENFPYFFLSNLDASVSCLIALARTVSTTLNRNGEKVHPCLVPDLGGSIQPFTISCDVSGGFLAAALYQVQEVLMFSLLSVYILKGRWILSSAFSASLEMISCFWSFILLIRCLTLNDFSM